MKQYDAYCSPLFLVNCRVSVCKSISVLYSVPNILFGIDGNYGAKSKTNIYISTTFQKTRSNRSESDRFSEFTLDICTRIIL